ncbi:hypothetical protein [Fodinicola acaciae]|uniref:hypothetical protein n=1 Tax=Fodinicola acaciae TaxID=2681555 RepID=UPI0013D1A140|nr:hypothetical protein [Fodinicola acaciae]
MGKGDKDDWSPGGPAGGAFSHDTVTHHGGETTIEHHEFGGPTLYGGFSLTVGSNKSKNVSKDLGGAENPSQWDLTSLDQTITWLNDMHTYLNGLYNKMPEFLELTGRTQENSHFGTFSSASTLWQKHKSLYDSFIKMYEQVMPELQDAATATGQLKSNYQSGEDLNEANAAAIDKAFADASNKNGHSSTTSTSSTSSSTSGSGYDV